MHPQHVPSSWRTIHNNMAQIGISIHCTNNMAQMGIIKMHPQRVNMCQAAAKKYVTNRIPINSLLFRLFLSVSII